MMPGAGSFPVYSSSRASQRSRHGSTTANSSRQPGAHRPQVWAMVRSVGSAVGRFSSCENAVRKGRPSSPVDAERLVEPVRERLRAFHAGGHHVSVGGPQPAVGFLEDDIDPVPSTGSGCGAKTWRGPGPSVIVSVMAVSGFWSGRAERTDRASARPTDSLLAPSARSFRGSPDPWREPRTCTRGRPPGA